MIPRQEETRRSGEATGSKSSGGLPKANAKSNRRPPSQYDRVKRFLERQWCCGLLFLDPPDNGPPILRYTGRIHELRKDGFYIDRRSCEHPWHQHDAQMWEWRIVGHVSDGTLPGIGDV